MNTSLLLKRIALILTIAVTGLGLTGAVAFANDNASQANQMSLSINGSGSVHLMGTVSTVNGNTMSVSSWLGTWQVSNVNNAEVKTGDKVSVEGTLGTGMSVAAKNVVDITAHQNLKKMNGTISNLNATAGTFTLATDNNGTVNVTTNTSTQVFLN